MCETEHAPGVMFTAREGKSRSTYWRLTQKKEAIVALVEVTVLPIGTSTSSLSDYVARALEPVKESGLKYELTSMGTNIEGSLEDIMRCVMKMHQTPFAAGVNRVLTKIVIDDRRDREITLEGKKRSVTEKR